MRAWDEFLVQQEVELGTDTVNKWLKPLKVIKFDACNLYLEAKDSFQLMWFEEHLRSKVSAKLVNNNKKRIKVHLALINATAAPAKKKRVAQQAVPQPPKFLLQFDDIDPLCTFDNVFCSESNRVAFQLLCKLALGELGVFNPIFLHGSAGVGKTHLLMATVHALRQKGFNVLYSRAETFTDHVVSAIRAGEMSVFRQAYRNSDVLCIDDVHVFARKAATQEELFHTFNTLHLAGKQIILSANCSPAELQLIEPRLISRFEWGIAMALEAPNQEELRQILQKKAEALHFPLNHKIVEFLIETFTSGTKSLVRALEALILRTHLQESSLGHSATTLTLPTVKYHLSDLILEEQQAAVTPEKVIKTVAEYFGLRPEDIIGKAQSREYVLPRQIAMHICRHQLKLPFMKIGDVFSKDHSTVMSSVKVIQKGLEKDDPDIQSNLKAIVKKIKN